MTSAPDRYVGRYWETISPQSIRCLLCPRRCILLEGQRGFCFVRKNQEGKLVLTTYGLSSGLCIDPIEKKPLYHFLPGTGVLSFGTAGCNLGCRFCQNWRISKTTVPERLNVKATPQSIARTAQKYGCASVAFTYNDPVIFTEYAIDTAQACHERGIKTVAVTAGYISEPARSELFKHIDAANVDLKSFSEDFYVKFASAHLEPVLKTLIYLKHETQVWLEITTLLIPGENDSQEEIRALTRWIRLELGPETPLHFSAFHPDYRLTDHPSTPPSTLTRARQIARDHGLRYVYTGNIHDPEGGRTLCHNCGQNLIDRDGFEIKGYHLKDANICAGCGTVCAGIFQPQAGTWGTQRLPVGWEDIL